MLAKFYADGGYGMHPTALFGFFMVVAAALYAIRGESRYARISGLLGAATFAAGLLGTFTGVATSIRFVDQLPPEKQFITLCYGLEESLHNVILSLVLIVLGCVVAAVGVFRARTPDATAA
ncbi:MAG: hypothetical protein JNL38_25045 [Myxococcales bacterium]|jgi:hypothetical protein|nr:hypothetical protein [Myxococcales bacterium]